MKDETGGSGDARSFEQVAMPHMDAAFNLARWLVRNAHDAEDIVPETHSNSLVATREATPAPGF